jgi:hypothetical protein
MPCQAVPEEALQVIHRELAVERLSMHDVPQHTKDVVQRGGKPRRGVSPTHVLAVQELQENEEIQ